AVGRPDGGYRDLPAFPTRRSSDLRRQHLSSGFERGDGALQQGGGGAIREATSAGRSETAVPATRHPSFIESRRAFTEQSLDAAQIGKSTRLNSSHVKMSYAVFCLK